MTTEDSALTNKTGSTVGVLLMTFGSPRGPAEVPAYLTRIRRGREPTPELVQEFQERYRLIGGQSPLLAITQAQAQALEALLNKTNSGARFRVAVGMQHAEPFIAEACRDLTGGAIAAGNQVERLVGIILSPQYSPIIMGGYHRALNAASAESGTSVATTVAGSWHDEPLFQQALAQRITEAQDRLPAAVRASTPVLLTAHSMPQSVVERDPKYMEQLRETADMVAARAGLQQWQFAFQSAGHSPGEWLRPDLKELFPSLAAAGHRHVLVAPIQFVADHLEVLYDLDIAARAEAEDSGLRLHRTDSLNCSPRFIETLAAVVQRSLAVQPSIGTALSDSG